MKLVGTLVPTPDEGVSSLTLCWTEVVCRESSFELLLFGCDGENI